MAAASAKSGSAVASRGKIEEITGAVARFAGDASDGIQLIGEQFTSASAAAGNTLFTRPDPPAEIRAPAGTLPGVCAFQVHFSREAIHTPGDRLDTLVVLNPAALRVHVDDLGTGGVLIANSDAFTPEDLAKVGYTTDPLQDGSFKDYRVLAVPMTQFSHQAVAPANLIPREASRCKNFFPLGLVCWLYERPLEPTLTWIHDTYVKNAAMLEASTRALKAGYHFGEMSGQLPTRYRIAPAALPEGRYRCVSGADALALGVAAVAEQSGLPIVFASYPTPPASELLHRLCEETHARVQIVQAEDDIAALNLALGASFGGALGMAATTGPGLGLQAEALGLAVMSELPCVVVQLQRAGPSTGMTGRTEQADLFQALFGRNGECPLIILAQANPADGVAILLEAARLAIRAMTPVIVLSDASLATAAEAWRVPAPNELPTVHVSQAPTSAGRNKLGVRPWIVPGLPGLEHRVTGLEKDEHTGQVSFEPSNHERMTHLRADKLAWLAYEIAPLETFGPISGDLLVLGWGSTFGSIRDAVARCQAKGLRVAHAHLRHLHPFPANTGDVLKRYRRLLVPELNAGQLSRLLRAEFLVDAASFGKLQGEPFLVEEIVQQIEKVLSS